MIYIFDLDGTLIDSSERMYRLFCELIPQCTLSKDEYWAYKRNKVNHKNLLMMKYPEVDFVSFENKWLKLIEAGRYLDMDQNYNDTLEVLRILKEKGHKLYLLTARQSETGLLAELRKLRLADFFEQIITTENKTTKEEILVRYAANEKLLIEKDNVFVSDMGKDIQLGNQYGYHTVAITHGFMSEERLKEYMPNEIIDELSELLK